MFVWEGGGTGGAAQGFESSRVIIVDGISVWDSVDIKFIFTTL